MDIHWVGKYDLLTGKSTMINPFNDLCSFNKCKQKWRWFWIIFFKNFYGNKFVFALSKWNHWAKKVHLIPVIFFIAHRKYPRNFSLASLGGGLLFIIIQKRFTSKIKDVKRKKFLCPLLWVGFDQSHSLRSFPICFHVNFLHIEKIIIIFRYIFPFLYHWFLGRLVDRKVYIRKDIHSHCHTWIE